MDAGRKQQHRKTRDLREPRLHKPLVSPTVSRPRWWGISSLNLATRQPIAHAIMFYLLSSAALLIFAPCVLVPIWQDVQRLSDTERAMRALVLELREQIARNDIRIEALTNDPLVVERVARRELNRRAPDEQHVQWSSAELAALRLRIPHDLQKKPELPPASMPDWVESVRKWLPAWPWAELFGQSPSRELLLVMAGCLLLTAFVLYTPRAECRVRDEE